MYVFFALAMLAAILMLPILAVIWIILGILGKDTGGTRKFFVTSLCVALVGLAGVWALTCRHQWAEASCTEPKTCQRCGLTSGELGEHQWVNGSCTNAGFCVLCSENQPQPAGHEWVDATCQQAKQCQVCGANEGEVLPCEYQNGACIYCGETGELVWIPQTGDRYHTNPDCSNMIDPSVVSIAEAQSLGFTQCEKCW